MTEARKERDQPSVRLFASVDLIGSTAFKNQFSSDAVGYRSGDPPWSETFKRFYWDFVRVMDATAVSDAAFQATGRDRFVLLKALGDELVFSQAVKWHKEAILLATKFRDSLCTYNSTLAENHSPLRVKGTLWIAGFPINNTRIPSPIQPESAQTASDYLGPSIDTGFRLAKYATKRKLVVSVDLALLLTASHSKLRFYFDGLEPLKGVLSEKPYPLVWIGADEDNTEERLYGLVRNHCDSNLLHSYCEEYITGCRSMKSWLHRPYLPRDADFSERPEWHRQIYSEWQREDVKQRAGEDEDGEQNPNFEAGRAAQAVAQAVAPQVATYLPCLPRSAVQQALRMSVRRSAAQRFGVSPARSGVGSPARRHLRQRMIVGVTSAR